MVRISSREKMRTGNGQPETHVNICLQVKIEIDGRYGHARPRKSNMQMRNRPLNNSLRRNGIRDLNKSVQLA
jgi:hypothetical protein